MAEKDFSLGVDPSKYNTYGQKPEDVKGYQKALEDNIAALEARYAQPNWFKVAAGFAKPQLGGFVASLGSAAEALGENVDQQRAVALPIAQMRAQLAQSNMLISNKQKASEIIAKAQSENRQLTPKEMTEVSNLDSERGQRIIQEQEARAKTVANNRAITEQNYKAMGKPMPVLNEMGLPETGEFPTGAGGNKDRTLPSAGGTTGGGATGAPKEGGDTAPKPAAGEEPKAGERVVLKTPGSEFTSLNPSEFVKTGNERLYKTLDDEGANHIKEMTNLASDANHAKTMRPIKDVLKYSDDPRFNNVMGVLSGGGYLSGLAALVENGLHVNAAGFNASLAIPLSKIALAIKDEREQAFAQNVYRALAQMELNNQRSIGLNPSSARNAEFSLLGSASAHPETLPSAARLYAKQAELTQLRNRDLYTDINKLIGGKHKKYVVDTESPTKMYLYMTSPSQKEIIDQYDKALEAEVDKYLKATGGVK